MNTIELVEHLLATDARTRDSDELLTALLWYREGAMGLSAIDFLKDYASGKYTSAETIRRCRQRLQETKPELRGHLYAERQAKSKNYHTIYEK